jgi:hypothetical protein
VMGDALDFVLPRFSRHVWTSDVACDEWEPRMDKIRVALRNLTVESVGQGARAGGLVHIPDSEVDPLASRCADRGLALVPLKRASSPKSAASVTAADALQSLVCGPLPAGTTTVLVGRSTTVESARDWWDDGACAELATMLGYPSCCSRFLAEMVNERRLDAMWSVAYNSGHEEADGFHISIGAQPETNMLWWPLGITALAHIPCSFGCGASGRVGQQVTELARAAGYDAEMRWMHEILSWPVSWSALHGIAETKTQIMKMVSRTDATAAKHTVDWLGTAAPNSVTGLSFPHMPPRRLKVSDSRSFQRGLANTDTTGGH